MRSLLGFLLIVSFTAKAQRDNVWIFADSARVNFNSGVPIPSSSLAQGLAGENNASVSDEQGTLLLYTS
ncbi:MAG: hypothetical protein ABIQ74_11060, partial [Chitinophagales bacterium]